jgi:hypothetical protein
MITMTPLREILRRYSGTSAELNAQLGGGRGRDSAEIDRDGLRKALAQLKKQNDRYFGICFSAVFVLFTAMLVTFFVKLNQPNFAIGMIGAFGGAAGTLIWRMFKMWEKKSQTEFFMHLTPSVNDDTLKTVIDVLAKKL